jgi:hypothetical protein
MSVLGSMALISPNLPDRHMQDILKMWRQQEKDHGLPQKSSINLSSVTSYPHGLSIFIDFHRSSFLQMDLVNI